MSSMVYSYFSGGYFDADGAPHFLHTDYQGSVVMVTDSASCVEQHIAYYPYGKPHREPAGQPILYAGKERLRTTADYNFDACRFCASMILMTVPDPSASSFHELSPYVYCGANPIRNVDLTGRKFTDTSMQFVNKLMAETNEIIDGFDKSILKKRTALNDESLSAKKRTKLLRGIEKLNNKKAMYQAVKDEIDVLDKSSLIYDISLNYNRNTTPDLRSGMGGSYQSWSFYSFDTGKFLINLGDRSLGSLAHELKHAYQFENGKISFTTLANFKTLYDKTDEDEAYNRGKLFGQINETNSSLYNSLQDGPCSIPEDIKNDGAKLIEFAQRNQCAFRWAGKTYTPAGIK